MCSLCNFGVVGAAALGQINMQIHVASERCKRKCEIEKQRRSWSFKRLRACSMYSKWQVASDKWCVGGIMKRVATRQTQKINLQRSLVDIISSRPFFSHSNLYVVHFRVRVQEMASIKAEELKKTKA